MSASNSQATYPPKEAAVAQAAPPLASPGIEPLRNDQGAVMGVIGLALDVTDARHMNDALTHSQRRLAEAQSLAHLGSFEWDVQTGTLVWSEELFRIFGLDPAHFRPSYKDYLLRVHPDDRAAVQSAVAKAVAERSPIRFQERICRPDGSVRVLDTRGQVVLNDLGEVVRLTGACHDVTERIEAENALRLSEERYRRFFDDDLSGAFISTPDGRIIACNPAFAEMFGFASVAEAMQTDVADLYPSPLARQEFLQLLQRLRKLSHYEAELRHKTGRSVHVTENVTGRFDQAGRLQEIHGFLIDNSERKRLEQQFLQAQKMEAVGLLAGGVAHDFNNLLTAILGYSDLLLGSMTPDSPHRMLIEEIAKAGERAAELTRKLLAFSRKQVLRPQVIDLNQVVTGLEKMMSLVLGARSRLHLHLSPDLCPVKTDPGQIEQAIMNLIVNARDAMPRGGSLTIASCTVRLSPGDRLSQGPLQPGVYAQLSVTDTGCGIPPEVKARLFEPFFTTKEVGKGTGLGLATTYGIIKQHGGHVEVESVPQLGATFHIYLPCYQPNNDAVEAAERPPRGSETILLLEVDELLRSLVVTLLSRQGYRVLPVSSVGEATALCENEPGAIDLLISDVIVPGIGSRDLGEHLATLRPALRVLFFSGNAEAGALRLDLPAGPSAFLPKPFTAEALARAVRAVLDQPPAR